MGEVCFMAHKRKFKFKRRFIALVVALCVVALCCVYLSQRQKMEEIASKQTELEAVLDDLTSQEKRLEYMIEYRKSPEGKIQYACEKFGFVKEDDIVFELSD